MIENQFRASSLPTLGVDLELQLVDASTMMLRCGVDTLLAVLPSALVGSVKREFHSCCVEVSTDVCRTVDEVRRDLKAKLRRVASAAARRGLLLAWGGTHPFSHWKDQVVASEPRYRALADSYQETLLRQLTFGLHVHVGVSSGDAAILACDRIRDYLPVLLALSANSPYWCGRATGLQSHRVEVMGSLPNAGIPPRLGSWQSYFDLLEHLADCGFIETPRDLWWDVRPSPVHGTVEVRVCDMPLGLEMVLGLTSLIQCLVHALSRGDDLPGSRNPASQDGQDSDRSAHQLILVQNRWLASRHGLNALLVDPYTRDKAPARVLARGLIDHQMDVARHLGCADSLRSLRAKTWGPTGALTQVSTHSRTGSLREVVRLMARADSSGLRHPSLLPSLDHEPFMGRYEANL
jgi:carboxylate-amine ligase